MRRAYFFLKIFFLIFSFTATGALQLTVGPEIYHMERKRAGGTRQGGLLGGVRATLERAVPSGIYLGFDLLYAEGTLKGRNRFKRALASDITDLIAEIRAGYSFENPFHHSCITPFFGYGHFKEENHFTPPSPLTYTLTDSFNYFLFGFLSSLNFHPLLSIGFNFELKCMQKGRCQVSDDPGHDNSLLLMNDEVQARAELPLTFVFYPQNRLSAEIVPFYEFRHFGGRESYPYNFIDTKFQLFGARIALKYRY